jgi:hypothetical protein
VGEGIGFAELCRQEPPAPLLPLICAARRGPTTKSWLAPPIRARDQAGRQRPSLWPLDARWGQSNNSLSQTTINPEGMEYYEHVREQREFQLMRKMGLPSWLDFL